MDKELEKIKNAWPRMSILDRKRLAIAISALARRDHPLHGDIMAIMGDEGKTPHQKNRDLDAFLAPLLRRH